MDEKTIEKRLNWLDEQNRKTTDIIKQLSDMLTESRDVIKNQSNQIEEMNDEISRLAGLTTRIHQVDETIQLHRKEVIRQLDEAEKRRSEKEVNLDALRKSDQKALTLRLDQLQVDLSKITDLESRLSSFQEEQVRLNKDNSKLEKQFEKLDDKSSTLRDQLKSLTREHEKIAKGNQKATGDLEVLRKRVEEYRGKLDALSDGNRSLDIRITELMSTEAERSDTQSRWIERQELSTLEFENEWKKWGRRFDAIEQGAHEFDERLAAYEELHRTLKQMRTELGELMERLERRITEVSEMQRLGDNRMKHEWSTFQAEDLKRWNTHKLTMDEIWREHNRLHETLKQQYQEVSEDLKNAGTNIDYFMETERVRLSELLSMFREWVSETTDRDS